jgi:hypothetical protein
VGGHDAVSSRLNKRHPASACVCEVVVKYRLRPPLWNFAAVEQSS